jgi:hypothetical protein
LPYGRINTSIPLNGEYEIRFTLRREGEILRTSFGGVVVSGTPTSDWIVAGIDGKGQLVVRRYRVGAGGGTSEKGVRIVALDPLVAKDESPVCKVHVFPEPRMEITVGDRAPVAIELDAPWRRDAFAGVIAKNGRAVIEDAVVEIYP